jgi:hypothetical protein
VNDLRSLAHFFVGFVAGLGLQLGVNLLDFADPYQVCHLIIVVEYFHRCDSALFVFSRNQFLTNNIRKTERELVADLVLPA